MKVTLDSKKGLKTKLKVFVDKKAIDEKIEIRLNELSKSVNLKGFRPGKVPVHVLQKQFGKAVYGEVLEKILKESSTKAIEERKIKVAGQPKIDLKTHGEGKDLNYALEIDELPSIKLKSIEDLKIDDYEITVTKEEVEKKIKDISESQRNFVEKNDKEVSKIDDLIVFDYEATIDNKSFEGGSGKNTQIVLGKDSFIQGFDKQLLGVKKNEEKFVTSFLPSNYPKTEFANKKANFKCKIISVKKPDKIIIDDNFAKNLGAKDLNDLRVLINKQIQNQYKYSLDTIAKENILDFLEKKNKIDLPENLVEQELHILSHGLKKEDAEKNKKENEKAARKRIKLGLILNEFGEQNNLKVSEEEMKNEIQKQIQSMPGQSKQVMEYYQKNPSAAESLRGSIYEEKIINLIKEKVKKTKRTITTKKAKEILKEERLTKKTSTKLEKEDQSVKSKKTLKKTSKSKKIRKK